jgi:hypothetical protein
MKLINIGSNKDEQLNKQMYKELKNEIAELRERYRQLEELVKNNPDKKVNKLIKKLKGE